MLMSIKLFSSFTKVDPRISDRNNQEKTKEMTDRDSDDDPKSEVLRLLSNRAEATNHELRICLFAAALKSYKCDSLLRPFPQQYFDRENNEKRFDWLTQDFDSVPALDQLSNDSQMSDKCWKLVHWIITCGSVRLTRQPMDCPPVSVFLPQSVRKSSPMPSLVFQVVSPLRPSFVSAAERFGTFWAFHGSQVENMHSIMHNGLVNNLNKRSLFGEGTYVSPELSVAIQFSPFGFGWTKSWLGKEISGVVVCQVVKHPDLVRRHSSAGVPHYYVITNDELIKVEYLLVYRKQRSTREPSHR